MAMDIYLEHKDRLAPDDALASRSHRPLGALRAQSLPIPPPRTSFSSDAKGADMNLFQSPRTSISSFTSMKSTGSSATTYTYSTAPSTPVSLVSRRSPHSSQLQLRPKTLRRPVFQGLPLEIYDCILQQLRVLHEDPASQSCQTCHLRDLCSLALTSRAWDKAVVKRMYDRIHLVGPDSKEQMKKYKMKTGVRLKLLRRTLRERSFLAQHVLELKVPCLQAEGDPLRKDMINIVASLVMACPNLERLVGFYPVYGHEFDRLTHALSTRKKLKEQMWLIGENAAITQRSQKQLAPGLMDPEQKESFVSFHHAWTSLTTLFLHSPGLGILEKDIFVSIKNHGDPRRVQGPGILHRLPALKHLCISSFDMDDFDDYTLQYLPALHSLRLQDLEGVTFWGLSEFSRIANAFSLRNLSLINLDIMYISAISNLLLHLKNLRRFTLVQDTSPEVAEGEIAILPIIASHLLEFLHWEIIVPGSANVNLADSIRAKGFPRLRTIRAPSDHLGLLQALCKPRAQIELPSDWNSINNAHTMAPDSLLTSRRAAQQRLEEAWNTVQFKVVVQEEDFVHEIFDLNGFIGEIGSKIDYSLEPDVPGSDQAWIDFPDVDSGRDEMAFKDSCRGLWNASNPGGYKWWQHTERPRYRRVDLLDFF